MVLWLDAHTALLTAVPSSASVLPAAVNVKVKEPMPVALTMEQRMLSTTSYMLAMQYKNIPEDGQCTATMTYLAKEEPALFLTVTAPVSAAK